MLDKRIIPLAMGGLGIGTTEFTVMGLLPDIAGSMNISIPEAGHFISAYALGVVIGAPVLVAYSMKQPPKKVLLALMVLFTVFNALSAFASDYSFMIISRFLAGLPHGAFFGVGTVVASTLGGKGKEALYISLMFTGLTIANLAMVPFVTYIGHAYGWRWYFVIVAIIGLLTLMSLIIWLPKMESRSSGSVKNELQFLRNTRFWLVFFIAAIGFGGLFTWFSYITPLMTMFSGFDPENMAYIMILAGAGMVIGNLLGGVLSDKIGASKSAILLLLMMMLALAGVFLFAENKIIAIILTFICGGLSLSTSSPINMMMMKSAPGSEMMGAAFMQAAFNIANSAGAYFGGIPLEHGLSYNYPSLVGVGMTLIGLIICLIYFVKFDKKSLNLIPSKK